jgi:hypothetical protein
MMTVVAVVNPPVIKYNLNGSGNQTTSPTKKLKTS